MKPKPSGTKPKRYPSDLTPTQGTRLKAQFPPAKPGGRPREVNLRAGLNGLFDIARGGWAWRRRPTDLPPGSTGYDSFRTGRNDGTWSKIKDAPRPQVRHRDQRKKSPGRAIIDSPSVKTTEPGGPRGKDAFKKVSGRKRHRVVDPWGMVVAAVVQSAGIPDREGAQRVLEKLVGRFPRRERILADGISNGGIAQWAKEIGGGILGLVVRPEGQRKFEVLKGRWVVERTFAWLGRYRRSSQDDEGTEESSESWTSITMTHLRLRRLEPA